MKTKQLVVIGGGAAGFFCAVTAARSNRALKVVILEKSSKVLSKVKISGGGRCNVTHNCFSIAEMVKNYPRGSNFVKQSFKQFFTTDTISWFKERGVELKAEDDGRMFPVTDSSDTIINCLLNEARKLNVEIRLNCNVKGITHNSESDRSALGIDIAGSTTLLADYVCVACGGFHKSSQYDWLRPTGHRIEEPVPSLFTFNAPGSGLKDLMGISVEDTIVKIKGTNFSQKGPLLITHWGFSGPAVLKLSAFAAHELAAKNYRFSIVINWLGQTNESALMNELKEIRKQLSKKKIKNHNPFHLPSRLWIYHLVQSGINTESNWADLPLKQQNLLAKNLCSNEFDVAGKTTFKEEFVTAGGISLSEVSARTMESRLLKGLYFAGEILDVDGITGGFNFQHAWSGGYIAGKSIAHADI